MIKSNPTMKAIPVIMVTGIGHKLSVKLSADGYVTNTFSLDELLGVIAKFLPCSE